MTEISYAVGWYHLTPPQLQEIHEDYRDQCQSIELFGSLRPVTFPTVNEAQQLLDQILKLNSRNNLRAMTGVGPEALFLVTVEPRPNMADPWEALVCKKHVCTNNETP